MQSLTLFLLERPLFLGGQFDHLHTKNLAKLRLGSLEHSLEQPRIASQNYAVSVDALEGGIRRGGMPITVRVPNQAAYLYPECHLS